MTTRASGTGLGLAIVKKIVEEHFGEIGFSDSADGGTCVTLRFSPALLGAPGGNKLSDDQNGPKDKNFSKTISIVKIITRSGFIAVF